jgi:hypothetical protein
MRQRVSTYGVLCPEKEDKAMRPASDLQYACIGTNALYFAKHVAYLKRMQSHCLSGIVIGIDKVVSLIFLILQLKYMRSLRAPVPFKRPPPSPPDFIHFAIHPDLPALDKHPPMEDKDPPFILAYKFRSILLFLFFPRSLSVLL